MISINGRWWHVSTTTTTTTVSSHKWEALTNRCTNACVVSSTIRWWDGGAIHTMETEWWWISRAYVSYKVIVYRVLWWIRVIETWRRWGVHMLWLLWWCNGWGGTGEKSCRVNCTTHVASWLIMMMKPSMYRWLSTTLKYQYDWSILFIYFQETRYLYFITRLWSNVSLIYILSGLQKENFRFSNH